MAGLGALMMRRDDAKGISSLLRNEPPAADPFHQRQPLSRKASLASGSSASRPSVR